MCLRYLLLGLLALLPLTLAHELCIDTSGPGNVQNTFCSAYSGHTCCSQQQDDNLRALHASLAISDSTCNTTMYNLLCAQCDPWGAHIFGTELQASRPGTPIPYMCDAYAQAVYQQCATVTVNWPSGQSPFNGANTIASVYADETAFCDEFCAPAIIGGYCYSGSPYIATEADFAFSGELCWTYWSSSGDAVFMQDLGDGTALVVLKHGEVRRHNIADGTDLGLFMNISNVYDVVDGEVGLLSIALHPNYAANGRFFAYYSQTITNHPVACTAATATQDCGVSITCSGSNTCNGNHVSVIAEFQAAANRTVGLANTKNELLAIVQPYGNHNGGQLLFEPSTGYLLIFLGDGGSGNDPQNRSQPLTNPFGKILRIDVDSPPAPSKKYAIPASNPGLSASWPETWVHGLRNPWRSSFDSADSSRLFVGDVGQSTREEVNLIISGGGNYGWRKYEGLIVNPNFVSDPDIPGVLWPIMDFNRTYSTCVIGGYVYHGTRDLTVAGRYIFSNLAGNVYVGSENSTGGWVWSGAGFRCAGANCPDAATGIANIWSFYEDSANDLYMLATNGIFRLSERGLCGLPVGNSTTTPSPYGTPPAPSSTPSQSPSQSLSPSSSGITLTFAPPVGSGSGSGTTTSDSLSVIAAMFAVLTSALALVLLC